MAAGERLTFFNIESAGDDVQDAGVYGIEDAVYVVDGAYADVGEGWRLLLLLLLLLLHASAVGTVVVVEKEAGKGGWMEDRCT